mmetsp:Transcript_1168/g.3388  ORF Transcript_1168/g.3388 Transcript_1168/m.3388 type:complete len:601 (-) Transcript_1168:26-1828(-)
MCGVLRDEGRVPILHALYAMGGRRESHQYVLTLRRRASCQSRGQFRAARGRRRIHGTAPSDARGARRRRRGVAPGRRAFGSQRLLEYVRGLARRGSAARRRVDHTATRGLRQHEPCVRPAHHHALRRANGRDCRGHRPQRRGHPRPDADRRPRRRGVRPGLRRPASDSAARRPRRCRRRRRHARVQRRRRGRAGRGRLRSRRGGPLLLPRGGGAVRSQEAAARDGARVAGERSGGRRRRENPGVPGNICNAPRRRVLRAGEARAARGATKGPRRLRRDRGRRRRETRGSRLRVSQPPMACVRVAGSRERPLHGDAVGRASGRRGRGRAARVAPRLGRLHIDPPAEPVRAAPLDRVAADVRVLVRLLRDSCAGRQTRRHGLPLQRGNLPEALLVPGGGHELLGAQRPGRHVVELQRRPPAAGRGDATGGDRRRGRGPHVLPAPPRPGRPLRSGSVGASAAGIIRGDLPASPRAAGPGGLRVLGADQRNVVSAHVLLHVPRRGRRGRKRGGDALRRPAAGRGDGGRAQRGRREQSDLAPRAAGPLPRVHGAAALAPPPDDQGRGRVDAALPVRRDGVRVGGRGPDAGGGPRRHRGRRGVNTS